jgi:cytochrome P450
MGAATMLNDSKSRDEKLTAEVFAPHNLSCPHATWAKLRNECPVARVELPGPEEGSYLVARKADIEFISQHPEIFKSEVDTRVWRWGGDLGPDFAEIFADGGYKLVHTIVTSDPPRAGKYRSIALEALSLGKVKALAPMLQGLIDELIAAIPDGETFDIREAFAVPLPLRAIIKVFGLPLEDADFIYWFTCEHLSMMDLSTPVPIAQKNARALVSAQKYLAAKIAAYRAQPADNFLSFMANWRDEHGELLSMEEALSMAFVTLIGGNETTRNALATGAYLLASDRSLWDQLVADRSRVPAFCEEVVRYGTPATVTPRQVAVDTELAGTLMPKGAAVYVLWGSGSHDERYFEAAGEFRLDRKNGRNHTSFGAGVHHCAGIHLARAELVMSVNSWLDAFESIKLAVPAAQIEYDPMFQIRALPKVPVQVVRRSRA